MEKYNGEAGCFDIVMRDPMDSKTALKILILKDRIHTKLDGLEEAYASGASQTEIRDKRDGIERLIGRIVKFGGRWPPEAKRYRIIAKKYHA